MRTLLLIGVCWCCSTLSFAQNLDSLRAILKQDARDTAHVQAMCQLGYDLLDLDADSSQILFLKSIELAKEIHDGRGEAYAHYLLGWLLYEEGEMDSALWHLEDVLAYAKNNELKNWMLSSAYYISEIQSARSGYNEALETLYWYLDGAKELKEGGLIAGAYRAIGNIFFYQKDYHKAISYYQQYYEGARQNEDLAEVAKALGNMAIAYEQLENSTEAIKLFERSIHLQDSIGRDCEKVQNEANLGNLYLNIFQPDKALFYLKRARANVGACGHYPAMQAFILRVLGNAYYFKKDYGKAEEKLLESYEIAEELEDNFIKLYTAESLAEVYESMGNSSRALYFMKIRSALIEEEINADMTEELTRLEMNYAFEKERDSLEYQKQSELFVMNARIKEQLYFQYATIGGLVIALFVGLVIFRSYKINQRAKISLEEKNKIISATLNEREILLREIHHRVKNNLQVVSSLLNIQSKYLNDELAKKAVEEGRNRVLSMALVHEKLYQSEDLSNIDVSEYLQQLSDTLFYSYNISEERVQLISEIDALKLPVDVTIQLGLIINELVSNALKHAFPEERTGVVKLSLRQVAERHELEITDDGVGMTSSEDLFKSYGYRIVKSIVRGLDGELEVSSEHGTRFRMVF